MLLRYYIITILGKSFFEKCEVTMISVGLDHSIALTSNKQVFNWGLVTGN